MRPHHYLPAIVASALILAGHASEQPQPNELRAALAATADIDRGQQIYRSTCRACHQSSGWGVADGSVPALAGQHRSVVLKQLVDMREDERHNPRMQPFLDDPTLGDAQALADVATYVAALEPDPDPATGPGEDLLRGEELYQSLCAHCHGPAAIGDAELRLPRLQGQHYLYLVRQLEEFASGDRHNIDTATRALFADLSSTEIRAVADFISRLEPDNELPARPPDAELIDD